MGQFDRVHEADVKKPDKVKDALAGLDAQFGGKEKKKPPTEKPSAEEMAQKEQVKEARVAEIKTNLEKKFDSRKSTPVGEVKAEAEEKIAGVREEENFTQEQEEYNLSKAEVLGLIDEFIKATEEKFTEGNRSRAESCAIELEAYANSAVRRGISFNKRKVQHILDNVSAMQGFSLSRPLVLENTGEQTPTTKLGKLWGNITGRG